MNDAPMRHALKEEARALPFILMIGIALYWGGGLIESGRRIHDEVRLSRPWINPEIQIRQNPDGKPNIFYDPRPITELSGTWTTSIVVGGVKCCTSQRRDSYGINEWPQFWQWNAWLGQDWSVPKQPFKVCAHYDLTTNNGARGRFGPFCSKTFKPESQL